MSEYQYYEFRAVERPLTIPEQKAVARLSSRVDPHPTRAVFVYNYTDFPGGAVNVLTAYYDALFYITNWGSVQLAFRFPKALVADDELRLGVKFQRFLRDMLPADEETAVSTPRTVAQLQHIAENARNKAAAEQKTKAEANRKRRMGALVPKAEGMWTAVDKLIQEGKAKPYDEA